MPLPASKNALKGVGKRIAAGIGSPGDAELLDAMLINYDEFVAAVAIQVRDALDRCRIPIAMVPRVKGRDTLLEKLRRSPNTALCNVWDIAGIRVTMLSGTLADQQTLVSAVQSVPGFEWMKVDRLAHPVRGYRAMHLVGSADDMKVEVQVRTPLQDAWAQMFERMTDLLGREHRYGENVSPESAEATLQDESLPSIDRLIAMAFTVSNSIAMVEELRVKVDEERIRMRDPTARPALRAELAARAEADGAANSDVLRSFIRNFYETQTGLAESESRLIASTGAIKQLLEEAFEEARAEHLARHRPRRDLEGSPNAEQGAG